MRAEELLERWQRGRVRHDEAAAVLGVERAVVASQARMRHPGGRG